MKKQINVLIADDHPIFRSGLRLMIEADALLKVAGEAEDGESALACIRTLQPDVAVLDIDMPPPDGMAVARQIQKERLPVEIIFLTMHNEEEFLNAALDAGVKGFIVKDGAANELNACIKAVAVGKNFISPTLSGHLLKRRGKPDTPAAERSAIDVLTVAERRVLLLISESMTNKEIAEKMFISVRTVEHHRSNICAKLNLTGKNALLTFALTHKSQL
ncbi:MAG TPA: response regulator transcription factor [Pyrinomonadaceae bacterium]|nr:response regulator transcription factor [Pyrinomonadaceae bacterium]